MSGGNGAGKGPRPGGTWLIKGTALGRGKMWGQLEKQRDRPPTGPQKHGAGTGGDFIDLGGGIGRDLQNRTTPRRPRSEGGLAAVGAFDGSGRKKLSHSAACLEKLFARRKFRL